MNSYRRKHLPQADNEAGQSLLSATKYRERGTVEKPFPSKPVCHKRNVNSTSHELNFEKKCQEHVPGSTTELSRLPAGEAQLSRVIQEKQVMLQKKLWKVEDALRQKIQQDSTGVNSNWKNEYNEKQEMVHPDTKAKQGAQVTEREVFTESQKNMKHKFRQETITRKHEAQNAKGDNVPAEKTMSMRKENGRATDIYNEPIQMQPEAIDMLAAGDGNNSAGRALHEDLGLPQVSSNPPQKPEPADASDTNIQLLPCHFCNRNFLHDRVEKHMQICEKSRKAKRPVFNSYVHRTKGSSVEDFWKTHTRSRTPEVLRKRKQKQHNKNNH